MNIQFLPPILSNEKNSIILDLFQILLEPKPAKVWLQKVANLLKQLLGAKHVVLISSFDNLFIISSDDLAFVKDKSVCISKENNYNFLNEIDPVPYWMQDSYIVPLSFEGSIEIVWDKKPDNDEIAKSEYLFPLINTALKNRNDLISLEQNKIYQKCLRKIETYLSSKLDLKSQLHSTCRELVSDLNLSRVQIKIFSPSAISVFDPSLSSEYVKGEYLEALSVVTNIEKTWLDKSLQGEINLLNQRCNYFESSLPANNIESLLSINSILGFPLTYKEKPIGVIIFHQCDYERAWKLEEINCIKEVAILLGLVLGKGFETNKSGVPEASGFGFSVMNSDEFLRRLGHLQLESKLNNACFSLLMVDIEKLKDINFKMGFVAGNLVLSQTARYINRLFGDSYQVARYSNDEFVIIMNSVDQSKARLEAEKLKDQLNNISVLGVGPVNYNFSFVTFPAHTDSISELLTILEQAMLLSKSRGKLQISSFDEVQGQPKERWQQLVSGAIPEIILQKSNLKTGPEVIETIKKQTDELGKRSNYSADILDSVQSLALALDAKDSYTEGHSKRVSEYAFLLAKNLGLDLQEIEWIRLGAIMHDIGKIGIPENILCKPGKLTKDEYEIMKKHPVIGAKILKPIVPLEKVANLVLYHHEYWDGAGYPNGLKKNEIPIGARIISIVDAYQAMTSHRPYRASLPFEEAIKRLKEGSEKQWDPELIEMFIKIVS